MPRKLQTELPLSGTAIDPQYFAVDPLSLVARQIANGMCNVDWIAAAGQRRCVRRALHIAVSYKQ